MLQFLTGFMPKFLFCYKSENLNTRRSEIRNSKEVNRRMLDDRHLKYIHYVSAHTYLFSPFQINTHLWLIFSPTYISIIKIYTYLHYVLTLMYHLQYSLLLQEILSLATTEPRLPRKTETTIHTRKIVQFSSKVPGGTLRAILRIWMECIWKEHTQLTQMEWNGMLSGVITTRLRTASSR